MLENKKVSEIIKLIQTKQISVKEVVEFYLARIEKYNPKLNAIVLLKETEKILEEAKKKDNQQNKNKSLFGLPLAVKDLSDVVGIQTTYGFKGYKDYFPKKNSFFVDKLIENGAIIIGKTNTAELGVGGHTINRLFGPTSNVYDLSKSSGGSSGGASSAVAAQLIPFADGTDQMGSCRNPAAYSNIYGFRPTPGVIASARSDNQKNIPILTTPGFLSRTPDDMTIILDSVTGKHILDPYSLELKSNFQNFEIKDSEIKNIKIGWLSDINGNYKFENEILEICEKKLSELNKQNIKIDFLKSDINTDELWDSWLTFRSRSIFMDIGSMSIKDINEMTFQAIWEYNRGKDIIDNDIDIALEKRNKSINYINQIFKDYDFLALPSAQVFPFKKELNYPEKINDFNLDTYHRWIEVFILSSLLELPTITVPVGFNKNKLPMGMQIIGKKNDDLKVLAFAKKYEQMFNYSKIKPEI